METLSMPWCFIGPAGVGKTTRARKMIADALKVTEEEVYPKDVRLFKVGDDYECRVYCGPYHFEIDIPDMSMQDKQILVEVLSMLFSAGDVFSGLKTNKRKLVILRRAHCLSLAAATRLRWILETRVCPGGGTGMIWICAREINGSLSVVEDIFVRIRVPIPTKEEWCSRWPLLANSYESFGGRMDRAVAITKWGGKCIEQSTFPRVITACYEDIIITIIRGCVKAAIKKVEHPPLSLVIWVRERVYDLLGLCQTGNEFLDGYTYAIESALLKSYCTFAMFRKAIRIIAIAEPNTSYRNPISLEKILLDLCIAFWETSHLESDETLYEIESKLPIDVQHIEGDLESSETTLGSNVISRKDKPKKTSTTGVRKPKKGSKDISGNTIIEPKKASKPKPGPRAKKPKKDS